MSPWKYDVFVSFRGEDIRKSFVDHLFKEFKQQGILAFRDTLELPRGEQISSHLYKAIENSRFLMVIFSKNYASSSWCLRELVKIVNAKPKHDVRILFYDVMPEEVRKPTKSYAKALAEHEVSNREEVDEWKKALTMASSLDGWDLNDMTNGYESKFIDRISKDIIKTLTLGYGHLHVGENLVGVEARLRKLNLKQSIGSNKVNMIGICGMSGIGKTTLAKAIYNNMYAYFEGSCFLEDVQGVTTRQGLREVQTQVINKLTKSEDVKISHISDGIMLIKKRVACEPILLVLDEVFHREQLEALAGSRHWFYPGSLIIFTSKDKELLSSHGVDQIYEMEFLDDGEDIMLFWLYAFRHLLFPTHDFEELAYQVVKYLHGHPLAIKVVGSALFEKPAHIWRSQLDTLHMYRNSEIQRKLRPSFDLLDFDQKIIFLDVARSLIEKSIDHSTSIPDINCFPAANIDVLVDKFLITISPSLQMHELIQSMAREVLREDSDVYNKDYEIWDSKLCKFKFWVKRNFEIPFEDIESATNNFADENLVTQTSSSKIYKGRLMHLSGELVNIVVRTFMQRHIVNNEVIMLKDLKHKNIVPIFKMSVTADNTLVIINKHEANGSLDKHLSSSMLSWMQRLHICVGIAHALSYLHYDADESHSVIHGNIKSSKILLDHDWEPKLHGFGFAVRAKRNQFHRIDRYKGSLQYMDPAYENTGGLTHKSDVFSFGVVLFEALFGRDASSVLSSTPDHDDKLYFARLARVHYEKKTLDDMIDPDLREQMNLESLKIFSDTAYFCLKEQQSQRPDMKKVLRRLKGALEVQRKHENPEPSTAEEGTSSYHLKVKSLDHLKVRLSDIKLATENFSDKYYIGSGGFATVYKAELEHFDGKSSPTLNKGENKVELTKRRSTVAIKRIFGRVDRQAKKGFLAEIQLLSKCKHPNIVSLIGFCNEENEMILIYEYATNGSLEAYLGDNNSLTNLTWAKRIKISIDIAHGLHYLHEGTEEKECIIHRDIKSANILLDDKWEAKIADFGLSKLHPTHKERSTLISGNIGGTQVYLDPEYEKTGHLKTSSDIYSFGVVLCEIMSGNLAYDNMYSTMGLPSIVRQWFNDGTIENLVDPQMKEYGQNTFVLNDGLNYDSLHTFLKIACQCVAEAQTQRPTMKVILKELEKSLNLQDKS